MHSTSNLDDGYIGSGKRLWLSINKHGRDTHSREILEFLEDRNSLKNREKYLVNELTLADPMCMNLQIGGEGGFSGKDHQLKCSLAGAKTPGRIEKSIIALRKCLENPEYFKKVSDKIKASRHTNSDNSFSGKMHNEETKQKMSKAKRETGSCIGEKNSQFGKMWITNRIKSIKILNTDPIPEGWVKGRKMN
jgi:hypothetical protein